MKSLFEQKSHTFHSHAQLKRMVIEDITGQYQNIFGHANYEMLLIQ